MKTVSDLINVAVAELCSTDPVFKDVTDVVVYGAGHTERELFLAVKNKIIHHRINIPPKSTWVKVTPHRIGGPYSTEVKAPIADRFFSVKSSIKTHFTPLINSL